MEEYDNVYIYLFMKLKYIFIYVDVFHSLLNVFTRFLKRSITLIS